MRRITKLVVFLIVGIMLTGCSGKQEYREGVANLKDGQYEKATEQFEKAIQEERNIGDSYRGIGIAKWETGDYKGAAEAFEKALENGSEETGTIYNLLGTCKLKLEDPAAAIECYEKGILQKDSTDEMIQEMRFNIIAACEDLKDWESAKERLAEYTASYPDDERAAKEAEFLETR